MHVSELAAELSRRMRKEARVEDGEVILSYEGEDVRLNQDAEHGRFVVSAELAKFDESDRTAACWAAIAVNEACAFDAAATIGVPPKAGVAFIGRSFESERADAPALLAEIDDFCAQMRKLRNRFQDECATAARRARVQASSEPGDFGAIRA